MVCKILNNSNTSSIKCLVALLIYVFIYILVLFHKPKKNGNFIFIEPHIIPSLGDTGNIFHYGWLKAKREGRELYTILPISKNMKYCFDFANIFCKPENIEEYKNPIYKILIYLIGDQYISFIEVMLLERLRQKYKGLKTFDALIINKDISLKQILNSEMRDAYLKRNTQDNFYYGHFFYNELLNAQDYIRLEIDLKNDKFIKLKKTLQINKKYICLHIKQQEGFLHPRFVFEKENYLKTLRYLIEKGYQIVLMGDAALSVFELDGIILYSKSKMQSIVNDLILIKNCNFFIGNSSGPMVYPPFYNKPQLLLNAMCLATLFSQENQRVLPKTITKDGKSLTIRELFESPIFYFDSNVEFDRLGYKYQDNSEEEIYESVLEFEKLVESNDFSLTNKQEIFKKNIKSYHMGAYIFKGFLCNHIL